MREIEVLVINDIYKVDEDEDGNQIQILVKKDSVSRVTIHPGDLKAVSECYTDNGRLSKTRCKILHVDYGELLIKERYKNMKTIIFGDEGRNTGFK